MCRGMNGGFGEEVGVAVERSGAAGRSSAEAPQRWWCWCGIGGVGGDGGGGGAAAASSSSGTVSLRCVEG